MELYGMQFTWRKTYLPNNCKKLIMLCGAIVGPVLSHDLGDLLLPDQPLDYWL